MAFIFGTLAILFGGVAWLTDDRTNRLILAFGCLVHLVYAINLIATSDPRAFDLHLNPLETTLPGGIRR
jgi:hypothetical protein